VSTRIGGHEQGTCAGLREELLLFVVDKFDSFRARTRLGRNQLDTVAFAVPKYAYDIHRERGAIAKIVQVIPTLSRQLFSRARLVDFDRIGAILSPMHEIVPVENLLSNGLVEQSVQVQRTPGQSSFILRKRDLPLADY